MVDPEGAITERSKTNNELSKEVEVFLPQGKGAISGKITDANTKEPIYRAMVIAAGKGASSAFSSLDGGYTIGGLAPGIYRLLAIKRGYSRQFKKDIEVKTGEITENIDFELNPRTRRSIALEDAEADDFDSLLELFLDFLRGDSINKAPSLSSKEEDNFFEALTFASLYFAPGDEEDVEEDLSRAKLTILPENVLISKDDEFEVEISLSEASSLLGAHLELKFDPAKLQAIWITKGELLAKSYPLIDNDQGKIRFYAARTEGDPPGSGAIVRVRFKAISDEPQGKITNRTGRIKRLS